MCILDVVIQHFIAEPTLRSEDNFYKSTRRNELIMSLQKQQWKLTLNLNSFFSSAYDRSPSDFP